MKKVIIIGGGASGLMAAYIALKNNAKVVIIEKKERIGSKILATGNGHCNFTNEHLDTDCYYNENEEFLNTAFSVFNNKSAIEFFDKIGVPARNKNGYFYPYNLEASSVLNAFRTVLNNEQIKIYTETNVISINQTNKNWSVITDKGNFTADSIIISCGTNASIKKDLNSSIIKQLSKLGHNINSFKPALTYLKIKEDELKLAAGVRFPVNISLLCDEKTIAKETGELQITSRGISGICVFQLSRFVSGSKLSNYKCVIDFMPDFNKEDINQLIYNKLKFNTAMNIEELFNGIIPKKLIIALAKLSDLSISKPAYNQIKELNAFIANIKNCKLTIIGTGDISDSQCLTGGIRVDEINPLTMESLKNKGLYFSGEVIDIDGKCGGYNLQWAWTSGYIAGLNASV